MNNLKTFLLASIAALFSTGIMAQCANFTYVTSNNTVTFTDSSSCTGAAQYLWKFGDNTFGSGSNTTHIYSATGTYTVFLIVMDSTRNTLDSTSKIVVISNISNPPCKALFSKSQALDSNRNPVPGHLVITDLSTGGTPILGLSYYWDFGDGYTSIAKSPRHTYTGNGVYILCLTVSDSNCTSTYCDSLSVDTNGIITRRAPGFTIHVGAYDPLAPVGIEVNETQEFSLFPNPVRDILHIATTGNMGQVEVNIINTNGQVMLHQNLNSNAEIIDIDVSHLNSGLYIVKINTANNDQKMIKLLVE